MVVLATPVVRRLAQKVMAEELKQLREDRDGWRAIAIEQQRLVVRLCEERDAQRDGRSDMPSAETVEAVMALIVGAGLRRRAALEPHSALDGDLGLDDIDREHIALACEDHFTIEIPHGAPGKWKTVADIARFVEACRKVAA